MRRAVRTICIALGVLAAAGCAPAPKPAPSPQMQAPPAAPPNPDSATADNGGGCFPAPLHTSLADQYDRVNPEWVPVVNGSQPDSLPILIHGTCVHAHGDTGGDLPWSHYSADSNSDIRVSGKELNFVGPDNDEGGPGTIHLEWESGAFAPFAWPWKGDEVTALGRWIWDCGHPDPDPGTCALDPGQQCVTDADCQPPICESCSGRDHCTGAHFHYGTELHPPYAMAISRLGRGDVVTDAPGAAATLATRTDVYVSPDGGGAGDRCVVTHDDDDSDYLFKRDCWPLSHPLVAKYFNTWDFEFDVPLPARPENAAMSWRVVEHPAPGGVAAKVAFTPHPDGASPTLHVAVKLTQKVGGRLPTGFSGSIYAGWNAPPPEPLTHVRVTLTKVTIHNPLRPAKPIVVPVTAWHLDATVNGEDHQRLVNLDDVQVGDIAEGLSWDQYLPPDGKLELFVEGTVHTCIDTLFAQSLSADIAQVGLGALGDCLLSVDPVPGGIDETFSGPDFGVGDDVALTATGSAGGHCSATDSMLCLTSDDCPGGESCTRQDGAFTAHFKIEKLP